LGVRTRPSPKLISPRLLFKVLISGWRFGGRRGSSGSERGSRLRLPSHICKCLTRVLFSVVTKEAILDVLRQKRAESRLRRSNVTNAAESSGKHDESGVRSSEQSGSESSEQENASDDFAKGYDSGGFFVRDSQGEAAIQRPVTQNFGKQIQLNLNVCAPFTRFPCLIYF